MDRCSPELVILIIEYACTDDFGQTARRLGLVSKYFRAIAETIEFRTIAVSGLKQLEGVCNRLVKLEQSEEKSIKVQHLFLSEVTMEHALAAETKFWHGSEWNTFWLTREGGVVERFYLAHTERFWTLASILVEKTSPTLKTLFLLAGDNWLSATAAIGQKRHPKVLGILSDAIFPSLIFLSVHHNVVLDSWGIRDEDTKFIVPETPSLRKLHIMSPTDRPSSGQRRHPLLEGPLQSPISQLTDLCVCCDMQMETEKVLAGVLNENWNVAQRNRKLPGKLRSVILQHGVMAHSGYVNGHNRFMRRAQAFVTAVEELHIDGLKARLPMERFPEEGKRRYELLFAEWKEQCLELL